MSGPSIPFLDLQPGDDAALVRRAIDRVLARGWFVLGPEVDAFEAEFAAASGARFAVGVASGTDAIALLLRAAGIERGDEVLVPAITAAYTALAVISAGATPIIVDVEGDTLTMDAAACETAITSRTRAMVPVHLYGQAADMAALRAVADRHHLAIVEDCCQAHLATERGVPVGTIGVGGAFSFYPTKNLAALGDGGAVITNDAAIAERVRRLRNGGQTERYRHVDDGVNSRLDEIQAAVLRERLPLLPYWTSMRRALAARYRAMLPAAVRAIAERDRGHVHHLFPIRSPRRDALRDHLATEGIDALIHYPYPLSAQPAFARFHPAECPVAACACSELLSLPLHPRLTERQQDRVVAAVASFERGHVQA